MEPYFALLVGSTLPLSPWLVGLLWVALFLVTQRLAVESRRRLTVQPHVGVEDPEALAALDRPAVVWPQFAFFSALLVASYFVAEPVFAFVAGGMVAMMATTFGLNLHGLAFAKRLVRGEGIEGTLRLSTRFVFEDQARRLSTLAWVFVILSVLLAHAALLGGAVFLGFASLDLARRARAAPSPGAHAA